MQRLYCSLCEGPTLRDDYDVPRCKVCGDLFCCEECRDEHMIAMHAELADVDPITDDEYDAYWTQPFN